MERKTKDKRRSERGKEKGRAHNKFI